MAWCGREYYLKAKPLDTTGLPAEVAATAPRLAEERGMRRPYDFSSRNFLTYLCKPYETRGPGEIGWTRINDNGYDFIVIYRNMRYNYISYILRSGKWELISEQERKDLIYGSGASP